MRLPLIQNELTAELKAAPQNRLTVWAVLYEDVYETERGDGYYAYLADAFFSREEAERFAAAPSAYRFHIRQVQLSLLDGRIQLLHPELNRSETIDIDRLVAALSHDPTPPQAEKPVLIVYRDAMRRLPRSASVPSLPGTPTSTTNLYPVAEQRQGRRHPFARRVRQLETSTASRSVTVDRMTPEVLGSGIEHLAR